jgi:hypothetical protein
VRSTANKAAIGAKRITLNPLYATYIRKKSAAMQMTKLMSSFLRIKTAKYEPGIEHSSAHVRQTASVLPYRCTFKTLALI